MSYAGPLAALATAVCWSANSVFFTLAGRRVGSQTVNIVRLLLALGMMWLMHIAWSGTLWPLGTGPDPWIWLGLSGFVGFALGDAVLFEALLLLGPRLAMLVMTLWPAFATLMAWAFLGEHLAPGKLAAMATTLAGIAWVVADRSGPPDPERPRALTRGLLFALLGALGQAIGFLFSKFGLQSQIHPVSANFIRVLAGTLCLGTWILLRGEFPGILKHLSDRRAFGLIALGALSGPVVGVVLSLYAQTRAPLGVASTLMSLAPVILLPVSVLVFNERVGGRAVLGTLVALGGASALFLL